MYIRAGSRMPTRAYVRPGLVYMVGSERRNCVVVFIGSQPAWMEQPIETRPGVPQNEGNDLVFDPATVETGSCSSGGVWRTAKRRKRTSPGPPTVETGSC